MIISKTPLRMSFVGGGTDFPDFFKKEGGAVIRTTIDKYIYIVVHPSFDKKNFLAYSKIERADDADEVQNTRIREAMKMTGVRKGIVVHSIAEVPTGVGLGGSSSFTVGLLNALYAYKGENVSADRLAREACEIEIERLREPIGMQDQYSAAYGGLNYIKFNPEGSVFLNPIILNRETRSRLKENLLLFYTGITREACEILHEQKMNIEKHDKFQVLKNLNSLTIELKKDFEKNEVLRMGEILRKNWELKKKMASKITNGVLDEYYEKGIRAGAEGGKILGAGGGGLLLFFCKKEHQNNVRRALGDLREIQFDFEPEGSKIIHYSPSE